MVIGNKEKWCRFSFVKVFEPALTLSGTMSYSVQILIPKEHKDIIEAVKAEIERAKLLGVSKKMFTAAGAKLADWRGCIRDGDVECVTVDDGSKDYLKGHLFFNASCDEKRPPTVVNGKMQPFINPNEFYSGCYGIVDVNFYPFAHGKGGVAAGLNHIMKKADGERLDGRTSANQAFADLQDDDDEITDSSKGDSADLR